MNSLQRIVILFILISILISACGGLPDTLTQSDHDREKHPNVNGNELSTLVDGNNDFALNLYQSIRSENGNLILSPFSISLALAMTYAGARGETEDQMAKVLRFGLQEQVHPAFNALDLALENSDGLNLNTDQEPMQINIANSIWAEQTYIFNPEFLDTLATHYGAGIHLSDFKNNHEPARKEINNWVSAETEEKIKDLLPENSVGTDTRMILVNAIYFEADWLNPFDANDTYDGIFHLLDGSEANTPMMGQRLEIPYATGNGYTIVELPYAGGSAVMDIFVPDEGRFEEVESTVSDGMLKDALSSMTPTFLKLNLPKFQFEHSLNLTEILKLMGMPTAFDRNSADFSGMTKDDDLFIGTVIHKAFVAVDEEGTEAAAATAVIMEGAGAIMDNVVLNIDRPFLFFIRDVNSGQILFIGRVTNP